MRWFESSHPSCVLFGATTRDWTMTFSFYGRRALFGAAALLFSACAAPSGSFSAPPSSVGVTGTNVKTAACAQARTSGAECRLASVRHGARPDASAFGPADFQARYNLPSSTKGSGQIVAIVDAYDNPNVASDLATYRSKYGLGAANSRSTTNRDRRVTIPPAAPRGA
jgi:hypothetical protein